MTLSAGNQLGAYQIVAPPGKVEWGKYIAQKTKDLAVAIKILPEHLTAHLYYFKQG